MSKPVSKKQQQQQHASSRHAVAIPAPFDTAPERLKPLLEVLDQSKVYVVHLDNGPREMKRNVFTVPVILNLAIVVLLLWRGYVAGPVYVDYIKMSLRYSSDSDVDTKAKTWVQLGGIIVWRTLMLAVDFFLITVIARWPITFFFERPGNPASWRWHVGFQDTEIYVRESRGWGAKDLMEGIKQGEESPFFKNRILPNIDRKWMHARTGYLMMGKDFDLDFHAMTRAHALTKQGKLQMEDLRKRVLVHTEGTGWCSWDVDALDEGGEEEARRKIVAFRDKLVAMGKESLFFRWLELLQYESTQPGGFTPERQREAVRKVSELFEREGVDFEQVVRDIGGLEGMPGLDRRT